MWWQFGFFMFSSVKSSCWCPVNEREKERDNTVSVKHEHSAYLASERHVSTTLYLAFQEKSLSINKHKWKKAKNNWNKHFKGTMQSTALSYKMMHNHNISFFAFYLQIHIVQYITNHIMADLWPKMNLYGNNLIPLKMIYHKCISGTDILLGSLRCWQSWCKEGPLAYFGSPSWLSLASVKRNSIDFTHQSQFTGLGKYYCICGKVV